MFTLPSLVIDNTQHHTKEYETLESSMEIFDIFEDIINLNVVDNKFKTLIGSLSVLDKTTSYIALNGVTDEIKKLIGPQLEAKEVDISSPENMIEGISKVSATLEALKIKETIKLLIDAFIRLIEKLFDSNRKLLNSLQEFVEKSLADLGQYNEDKFKAAPAVMFKYDNAKALIKLFGDLDYHKVITLEDDKLVISDSVIKVLSKVGYSYSDGVLSRSEDFQIARERLSDHGYKMTELKNFTLQLIAGMKKVRVQAGNTIGDLKDEAKKADTPELAAAFRERISYTRPVIVAVERISNILARQVLGLEKFLIEK